MHILFFLFIMKKSPGYGTQNFDSFCEKNLNFLTIFKINVVPKKRDVQYLKKKTTGTQIFRALDDIKAHGRHYPF